jgi:hypothetical protein
MITTKQAVEQLITALKEDEGHYNSWKANIAMAFKDACHKEFEHSLYTEYGDAKEEMHEIANTAADNFLKQLIG